MRHASTGGASGGNGPVSRLHDLQFDPGTGEIWRDGRPVDLAPQPTRLFTLLARRPGRLVTRDEIRREIWGDTAIDVDTAINNAVREIRDALGDDASDPRYVETVPRRGYRLIADVEGEVRADGAEKEGGPGDEAVADGATVGAPGRGSPGPVGAPGSVAARRGAPPWLWPAGVVVLLSLALWLVPALMGPEGGPPSITVVPVRADQAGSAADRVADRLTDELEAAVGGFGEGELAFVPWEGVVEYERETGRLVMDGEPVAVDLGVDANVTGAGDSLRVSVSLVGLATGSQLWQRAFLHPAGDPDGLVRRVRERVSQELEARLESR